MLTVLAVAIISSCSLVEDNISLGYPHIYGHRNSTRTGTTAGNDSTGSPVAPRKDTLMYLSAVRFPVDYDWKKDSAYGAVTAELVLMCNYHDVLSIPVGPHVSAAADRHHIVDGHLVTEFQASSRTYIGIDGKELISMEGRHVLMGVLEHEGTLYTLTRPVTGEGFCLMANGSTVLSKGEGKLYGSMAEPSYSPNGALYLDAGKVCFCFASNGRAFMAADGVESQIGDLAASIHDARMIDGTAVPARSGSNGLSWQDSRIWPLESGYAIAGIVLGKPMVYRTNGSSRRLFGSIESTIYVNDVQEFALSHSRDGIIKVAAAGKEQAQDGNWYFFSPKCACLGPKGPALALTPRGSTGKPVVVYAGDSRAVSLNGFLTGIQITTEEN